MSIHRASGNPKRECVDGIKALADASQHLIDADLRIPPPALTTGVSSQFSAGQRSEEPGVGPHRRRPVSVQRRYGPWRPAHELRCSPGDPKLAQTIEKYASLDLIVNCLARYMPLPPNANGCSRMTCRVNPMDIMLVFAKTDT